MAKFAFLVHPRKTAKEDMAKVFKPLGWLPESFLQKIILRFPPFAFKSIIKNNRKKETIGWIITIPMTGNQLMSPSTRRLALKKIIEGVEKAKDLGASIVGLGALTAPATHGGKDIVDKIPGIKITNGNALTAYITIKSIQEIAKRKNIDISNEEIAIVGATGSVGSAVSMHLAKNGNKVLLIGRSDIKLNALAEKIFDIAPLANISLSKDVSDIKRAKVVIILTSCTGEEPLIHSDWYAENALVYDDTQPRETTKELSKLRPDILIVDGGVVNTEGIDYGIDIGFGSGRSLAYACLTETVNMALDNRIKNRVGNVEYDWVIEEGDAFEKRESLSIAPYTSFGKTIA